MARYYRKFFADRYSLMLMPLVLAGIWARFTWVALGHLVRRALATLGLRQA
jgi:hypothetical protein